MNDRFTMGFLAGSVAAVPAGLWNLTSVYLLKIASLRWTDFAAILILGTKNTTVLEEIFTSLAALFFAGLMGILFAYVLPRFTSENYLFKGWVFGVTICFFSFAITYLFKIPELLRIDLSTAFSNFIGASIWGPLVGYILKRLDKRVES